MRRFRTPNAFAALAGVAPIPASSGQVQRMRLNRGGNRQLNRALHVIAVTQARFYPPARRMSPVGWRSTGRPGGRRSEPLSASWSVSVLFLSEEQEVATEGQNTVLLVERQPGDALQGRRPHRLR
jgi:hypothetical protein